MKRIFLFTTLIPNLCFTFVAASAVAENKAGHLVPAEFATEQDAANYVNTLFAGGHLSKFNVGADSIIVISVHGSGVPEIAFAAYALIDGRWKRESELCWGAMNHIIESHKLQVIGEKLMVVGEDSGQSWVLFSAQEQLR